LRFENKDYSIIDSKFTKKNVTNFNTIFQINILCKIFWHFWTSLNGSCFQLLILIYSQEDIESCFMAMHENNELKKKNNNKRNDDENERIIHLLI